MSKRLAHNVKINIVGESGKRGQYDGKIVKRHRPMSTRGARTKAAISIANICNLHIDT